MNYKFRGKSISMFGWVEGSLLEIDDRCFIYIKEWMSDEWDDRFWDDIGSCSVEVVPETVGMCTGIKDKNGKEIYDGDVLSLIEPPFPPLIGAVEYQQTRGAYWVYNKAKESAEWIFSKKLDWTLEVIGNVHDNPELIKEQK